MKSVKPRFLIKEIVIILILFNSLICLAQVKGGRWMFENNGSDESGWDNVDNNGSLSGAAFYSGTGTMAQGSYYLSLDDSANYGVFTVNDQEELDFLDEDIAISMWVFPVKGYDNPQHLLMKGDRSGPVKTNNYALRINEGYLEFIVHAESGANKFAKSSFKVVENSWNFLAVFYDFNNSKLYLWNDSDSSPADTIEFNAPLFPNSNKLYVGTSGENGFKRFWGKIDDIRIGNKLSDIIDQFPNSLSPKNNYTPSSLILGQNYPNPFNPETIIKFVLSESGFTKLIIYDLLGDEIAVLINNELDKGEYEFRFNAINLPSGVYLYKLEQRSQFELKKMILIK